MKPPGYLVILCLLILSCDESENEKTITDYQGISVVLGWKGIEPRNRDHITFVLYDPRSVLYSSGYDSIFFSYGSKEDGRFTLDVAIYGELEHQDYVITAIGHESGTTHVFENSFAPNDPSGLAKTSLYITKNGYNYTFKVP